VNIPAESGGDIGLVVAACNMAGYALKKSPAPDWLIPFALPIIGAALYCGITDCSVRTGLLGAALGWSAVGTNQALRQATGEIRRRTGNTEIIKKP